MSNMNNIENEKMLAFAKEYAELCRKHGLYLVFNDDVWLQEVGDEQDLSEIESDLVETLCEAEGSTEAEQWTDEEIEGLAQQNAPRLLFNNIGLFSNFIDGLVIQRNNGTISDENREILEKAENAIIKIMNESVVSYMASKIDDTFYDALAKERGAN